MTKSTISMMNKVAIVTKDQLSKLCKAKNQAKVFKDILGLPPKSKYAIGDTVAFIANSQPLEVYQNEHAGRTIYYLVLEAINDELAFAYSLYPMI